MYSFSSIIGQKAIKDHFQNALRTGSVSHAYIISGEKEAGKELITRTFAAALQCDDLQERGGLLEPCGACLSCLQVQSGNQPDIIVWPR
ncbi:MAG TPA: DNA polymerase III subunit delta, partial [Lachnospiraceae bacterium]|nr:DNA polymerase III subunit delta [Lachnospiraceae bacterium]